VLAQHGDQPVTVGVAQQRTSLLRHGQADAGRTTTAVP
jgi:hypothetical protein